MLGNLITKKWIKFKGKDLTIKKEKNKIIIENTGNKQGYYLLPTPYKMKKENLNINFAGKVTKGNSCILTIMTLKKQTLSDTTINSESVVKIPKGTNYIIALKVLPNTKVEINKIYIKEEKEILEEYLTKDLKNDILIITPSYPTMENKYLSGFVHSRLKAYKKNGLKFDVICSHNYAGCCKYNFEGIDVLRVPFQELRRILTLKKYKKILLHFFDEKYATILNACDLSESELYFWVHGPETLYWDWPKFTTSYFQQEYSLNDYQINLFKQNDEMIKEYNNKKNVHWIFVSQWIKDHSEKLINIKFNNFSIIPNIIDSENFKYIEKDEELRKKVFFIRRFDDCNKYAIDVNVRAILELSRRECFKDMEFNIYGTGGLYDELIAPLKEFDNVHFYQEFLTHEQISEVHKKNGIGLFATRYDAQGVSMCEAAMSGLAIITSNNEAIIEFLPPDAALISETENYIEYANNIEKLYNDPKLFKQVSYKCHQSVYEKCNYDETVSKEIELIKNSCIDLTKEIKNKEQCLLSIIIPSYNVEKYIAKTISSIMEAKLSNKIELIIVNDGSKDKTSELVKKEMKKYNSKNNQFIKLIDKENGGHGSTINVGLAETKGKYTRIIDGDDWINSYELDKLLEKLEFEDSDIVITDYSEDIAYLNTLNRQKIYGFMIPGLKYNIEDLCDENYGFKTWGPILATSNFKTETLKKTYFKLTEKCFYVDMEFNVYSIINAKTLTYYPYDIYRYFIGRDGQSVSKESFTRNYKQHRKVLFKMIDYVKNSSEITESKKKYIYRLLINPMANAHYIITTEYIHKRNIFMEYDKKLKEYPEVYYSKNVNRKIIKLHRKTKGLLLPYNDIIIKIYNKIKRR